MKKDQRGERLSGLADAEDLEEKEESGINYTKKVSDRINKIKADYERQLSEQAELLKEYEALYGNSDVLEGESNELNFNEDEAGFALEEKEKDKGDIDSLEIIKEANNIIELYKLMNDLKAIKEMYPEVEAESPLELGEKFVFLMRNGNIDALTAYEVAKLQEERELKKIPPSTGDIDNSLGEEKSYYTSKEVDNLPKSAYDNPKIMERVRKSMLKW